MLRSPERSLRARLAAHSKWAATANHSTEVPVRSHFKLVFLTVSGFTAALLAADIGLAVAIVDPSEAQQRMISTCDTMAKAGLGVIFGLIGGKHS